MKVMHCPSYEEIVKLLESVQLRDDLVLLDCGGDHRKTCEFVQLENSFDIEESYRVSTRFSRKDKFSMDLETNTIYLAKDGVCIALEVFCKLKIGVDEFTF